MHGMGPFVAAITSIPYAQTRYDDRCTQLPASARLAMKMWRTVMPVAIRDPDSVSIPIDQYTGATTSEPFVIVSDASPTGMCAAQ